MITRASKILNWSKVLAVLFVGVCALLINGCSKKKVEQDPDVEQVDRDGDSDYREAQLAFKKKEYADAIELLNSASEKDVKLYSKSDLFQLMGLCYRHLFKYEKAIEFFGKSIEEDPQNHEAYIYSGVVYRVQKKYGLAAKSYDKALELKPDNAELHTSLGALHIFQKKFDKAIEHLQLAIDLDGAVAVTHSNLAIAYAHVGEFDKAKACLEQATILGYKQPDVIQAKIDNLKLAAIEKGPDDEPVPSN